ncbi:MAG: sodium:proline symporter, partial [Clostridiales bacterium]|nr:sodium:proline symporter [Clostridiales bacterium]
FMVLIQSLFHPAIAGIFLAAVLASIMSTVDSQLLVASSSITKDFYQIFLKKEATDRELVVVGRIAVGIISIIAFILALKPDSKVLDLVSYAWAGLGSTFAPIVVISLYWRDMNKHGAFAGMVVGGITSIVWNNLSGGMFDIYELIPGFIFASITVIVVSKLTGGAMQEIRDEFDQVETILTKKN